MWVILILVALAAFTGSVTLMIGGIDEARNDAQAIDNEYVLIMTACVCSAICSAYTVISCLEKLT